jgi:hypothetical protein
MYLPFAIIFQTLKTENRETKTTATSQPAVLTTPLAPVTPSKANIKFSVKTAELKNAGYKNQRLSEAGLVYICLRPQK